MPADMTRLTWTLTILLLAAAACGDGDAGPDASEWDAAPIDAPSADECGAAPGYCDDVGDLTGCGVTLCGAWEKCTCVYDDVTEEWGWDVEYVDCLCAVDGGVADATP